MKHSSKLLALAALGGLLWQGEAVAESVTAKAEPAAHAQGAKAEQASAAFLADSKAFISDLSTEVLGLLRDKKAQPQLKDEFSKLLDKNFAIERIARFTMGRYWRRMSGTEREEFVRLFREMIIGVYAERLNDYRNQTIEVLEARLDKNEKFALVQTKIVDPARQQPVYITWRIIRSTPPLKIMDVSVEGVSMGVTQRSEFSSFIQRNGGQVQPLLTELRQKYGQRVSEAGF